MKFMVTWQIHEDKRHELYKASSMMTAGDDQANMGSNIKMIGRWHDLATMSGVAIAESDDASALFNWALNWNENLDVEITPVLDDDEARALGKKRFG